MGSFEAMVTENPARLIDLLGVTGFFDGSLSNLFGSLGRILGSSGTPDA